MPSHSDTLPLPAFKAHLFICTHSRETGESCGMKGSVELRDAVKKACKRMPETRVNASGCLGQCERGIAAVLYSSEPTFVPQWYLELKASDADVLVSAVLKQTS